MNSRAVVNIPGNGYNHLYCFKGNKYAKIDWTIDYADQHVSSPPSEFTRDWASLEEVGFTHIDAILPTSGSEHKAYCFSGSRCVCIGFTPGGGEDRIYGSVLSITEGWKSLAKAGFDRVDAALLVPDSKDQAYFFNGGRYCRVAFREGMTSEDVLLDGPKPISEGWSAIPFSFIDGIFLEPRSSTKLCVFSGPKCAKVLITEDGRQTLVAGPTDIAHDWPSLRDAGMC
ncbi:hemopexin domain protein [Ceratobasidium sp. AG-Ba]|nr:hemopexin domain protein [Ceratobasidium sp. AG-Ba]QRW12431.1 hemopexin domain protein [Ceratobasidium sp. AG-Ba]